MKIDSVRDFVERCEKVDAVCQLVEYEGAGHSFFNHPEFKMPKTGAPDYYTMTMNKAINFLKSYGYIKADEQK